MSATPAATQRNGHADADHGHEHSGPHVVPLPLLIGTFVALLVLTGLTVGASTLAREGILDLGSLNIWIALIIAGAKATLVGLFFMHLRWDKPFNVFVMVATLAFVILFLGFAMLDTRNYETTRKPAYAPNISTTE